MMDRHDARLLDLLQEGIPAVKRPFAALGDRLGLAEEEVIARVRRLKEEGFIRRMGAIVDSRSMGYASALCGMKVPLDRVDEVAAIVNERPGVTHNYLRDDEDLNMWFTLTAPGAQRLDEEVRALVEETGLAVHAFPALNRYKIKVFLPLGGDSRG